MDLISTLFLCAAASVPAAFGAYEIRHHRQRRRQWQAASARLGLSYRSRFFGGQSIRGSLAGFSIRVAVKTHATTMVTVDPHGAIPVHLHAERPAMITQTSRRILTDDGAFDLAVAVTGDEPEIFALLDVETRRLLKEAIDRGASVRAGKIECTLDGIVHADLMVETITRLVQLAEHLSLKREEVLTRLSANLASERIGFIRLRLFDLIMKRSSVDDPIRRRTEELALNSNDLQLRTQGAINAEERGLPILKEILSSEAPAGLRAKVLRHLAHELPHAEVTLLVDSILAGEKSALRDGAIDVAARLQHRSAIPRLLEILERAQPEEMEIIAIAFGRIGDSTVEAPLISLLRRREIPVEIAAARALGRVGSLASVQPLFDLARRARFNAELKKAAEGAIARIQARCSQGDRGGLSLAGAEGSGALSLDREGGALSVPDDESP